VCNTCVLQFDHHCKLYKFAFYCYMSR
jgi:hypothetical protein